MNAINMLKTKFFQKKYPLQPPLPKSFYGLRKNREAVCFVIVAQCSLRTQARPCKKTGFRYSVLWQSRKKIAEFAQQQLGFAHLINSEMPEPG
jgi:hypothetical protein